MSFFRTIEPYRAEIGVFEAIGLRSVILSHESVCNNNKFIKRDLTGSTGYSLSLAVRLADMIGHYVLDSAILFHSVVMKLRYD